MDLKIKDVAELLNVSEKTIRRWLTESKIPAYRINNQFRFNRSEIEAWVMSQKLQPAEAGSQSIKLNKKSTPTSYGNKGMRQFSLYRAIHKGGVIQNVHGKNKEEVIRKSMKLAANELDLDAEYISNLLLEREGLQATGIGNGIGIPHTRDYLLENHHDIVIVAFPETPLEYGSLDGKQVHSLFFLFACEDKRHLHLLAKLAYLSSQSDFLDLLKTKPNKETLLEYIKNWEGGIPEAEQEDALSSSV